MKRSTFLLFFFVVCTSIFAHKAYTSSYSTFVTTFFKKQLTKKPLLKEPEAASIQVALLLDTSSSMSGLIEQAKSQLWKIINKLNLITDNGESLPIYISLYEYGNDNIPARSKHIRQILPFTTDLDLISDQLFRLTTRGGEEYCGQVIHESLNRLQWVGDKAIKMIYIAGNESFEQGPYNYGTACGEAGEKGVVVNTIFCGGYQEGVNLKWKYGAQLTDGTYINLDHNRETVYISTPYDQKISNLNIQLNDTYIPMGREGIRKKENQVAQDLNAASYGKSNFAERTKSKISKNYKADQWDLLDNFKRDKNEYKSRLAELPQEFEGMNTDEIEEEIAARSKERDNIKDQIASLSVERDLFLKSKVNTEKEVSLEEVVIASIKKIAKDKKYTIEE